MGKFNKCCCCNLGSVIPKWQNITKVRPPGDTLGPNYTSAPFPRLDAGTDPSDCESDPQGTCGYWMFIGDANGIPAQGLNAGYSDIGPCSDTQTDHNCYYNDGSTTVDMTLTKLFGAQWVLAQKQWHGIFGFTSNDALPSPDPNVAADQTKYRTMSASATVWAIGFGDPDLVEYGYEYGGSCTVDQLSGIKNTTCSYSNIGHPADPTPINAALDTSAMYGPTPNISALTNGQWDGVDNIVDGIGWTGSWSQSDTEFYFEADFYYYENEDEDSPITIMQHYEVTVTLSDPYTATDCYGDFVAALGSWDMSDMNLAHLRQDEELANAPLIVYDEVGATQPSLPQQIPLWGYFVQRASGTMDDLNSPIDDVNGNAPFTSVNPTPPPGWTYSPGNNGTAISNTDMYGDITFFVKWPGWTPEYDGTPVDWIPTYDQIPWLDPNNYAWQYPDGGYIEPTGWNGGATLITPIRTGAIVAHTQAGSDPHFWFNYEDLDRQPNDGNYEWVILEHGGFSDGTIPQVSMRWQTGLAAQYDAFTPVVNPTPGNFPQMFWNQYGGQITGGKYVQATQQWPAVNYGRPCGPDKYAIDQTSVCCVTGGDATDGYTVVATEFANHPGATGGAAVGDYIMVGGDGLYQISSITDDGAVSDGDDGTVEQYTIMVGAILDTIPSGVDIGGYLGLLRFPTASGICGRAAISTSYDSGTVTITPAVAQTYLREGVTGGISVDIYDGTMTLLASAVALTRIDDSTFTVVHAAMATAAYMTGAGVNWTHYNSTSQRTGVHLEWTFDIRGTQSGVTSPPSWYGDITGCLSCSIAQFNYDTGTCPAVVGIVPFTDGSPTVEAFANQTLFDFPSGTVIFDDIWGNHGQAAVMLTMPDPFWQTPFWPGCLGSQTFDWTEDDGTSETDTDTVKYYPHHPLVEAASIVPSGESLPDGITLTYDPSNIIAAPFWPNGFSVVNDDGSFGSYATDWGFALNVCANLGGRFAGDYTFVSC
jgi:hypothetical protein